MAGVEPTVLDVSEAANDELYLEYTHEHIPRLMAYVDGSRCYNVNDRHNTVVVLAEHGDKVKISVIDRSGRSGRVEVDGLFEASGRGGGAKVGAKTSVCSGASCEVMVAAPKVSCENPISRVVFHAITERDDGTFIRDPLVIIVPKDNQCVSK